KSTRIRDAAIDLVHYVGRACDGRHDPLILWIAGRSVRWLQPFAKGDVAAGAEIGGGVRRVRSHGARLRPKQMELHEFVAAPAHALKESPVAGRQDARKSDSQLVGIAAAIR